MARFGRLEERKQRQRTTIAIGGSVAIIAFIFIFGLRILEGFSLLVDRIQGITPTQTTQEEALVLPPALNPLPEATNSAQFIVSGRGSAGQTIIFYLNEEESDTTETDSEGLFSVSSLRGKAGHNTISAKAKDENDNLSDLSNVLTVTVKTSAPLVEITEPADNQELSGETNSVLVKGKTEEENSVTINERFVVVSRDGSFSHSASLVEGVNTLKIIVTDPAGNTTTVEKSVTYFK